MHNVLPTALRELNRIKDELPSAKKELVRAEKELQDVTAEVEKLAARVRWRQSIFIYSYCSIVVRRLIFN